LNLAKRMCVQVDVKAFGPAAAARRWYWEKLGLSYSSTKAKEANVLLGYSGRSAQRHLSEGSGNERPNGQSSGPLIVFASKLTAAHEYLSSRGVTVGPYSSDSGGNTFPRFRDFEENDFEVCRKL